MKKLMPLSLDQAVGGEEEMRKTIPLKRLS